MKIAIRGKLNIASGSILRSGPADGAKEQFLVVRVGPRLVVMSEHQVTDPALAVVRGPRQLVGALGMIGRQQHVHTGCDVTVAVRFIVDRESGQTFGDQVLLVRDGDVDVLIVRVV